MSLINYYVRRLLKKQRSSRRLSLRRLGKLSGICFTTLASMESGKHGMSLDNLLRLAEFYRVPPSYFLLEAERLASIASGWNPNPREHQQDLAAQPDSGPIREEVALPA